MTAHSKQSAPVVFLVLTLTNVSQMLIRVVPMNLKCAIVVGTLYSACLGTSSVTCYVESAAGIAEGGRTGPHPGGFAHDGRSAACKLSRLHNHQPAKK